MQTQTKAASAPSIAPAQTRLLQRKCACGGSSGLAGECESCDSKKRFGLQTKLKVNEPGDIYEQEADRIADQVMATSAHHAVSSSPPRIQRLSGSSNGQVDMAPSSVDQVLASPGKPLEPALRQDMEQRSGHDFSRVRVHSGAVAQQSARDVNANAYTVGNNIVFGEGRLAPGTHEGQRLIAHELAHVVQQRSTGPKLARSPDDKEAAAIGSEIERLELQDWRRTLEAQGYEVFTRNQFDRVEWLAKAFSDKRARPDVVAINRKERKVLVGDITAGPWSQTALKPGDVRKLPRDIGAETETKHHLEKTVDNARQAHKHLPEDLKGFEVTARDRWWKQGGYSREITVAKGSAVPKPPSPARPASKKTPAPEPTAAQKSAEPPDAKKPAEPPAAKKPAEPPAVKKPAEPPAAKKPTQPPAAKQPTKAPSDVETPSPSGGSKLGAAVSAAQRTYTAVAGQVSGKLMQIASKDPKAAEAIADINKLIDAHAFVQNPKQFTAQYISNYLINGAFGKFSRQLAADEAQFFSTYPHIQTLYERPLVQGISLNDLHKRYDEAVRNLRLPSARKALATVFVMLDVTDKTPQTEIDRRKRMINEYLAKQPEIGRYVTQYNDAHDKYAFGLAMVWMQMHNLRQQLSELPASFADDIRRRGDALNKAASILDDLVQEVVPLSALPGGDMAVYMFMTLRDGFADLGHELQLFAYSAGDRERQYRQEIPRLEARADQVGRVHGAYDVIYPQSSP